MVEIGIFLALVVLIPPVLSIVSWQRVSQLHETRHWRPGALSPGSAPGCWHWPSLAKVSIDEGLLGPGARVLLGGLFGLGLIVAGIWLTAPPPPLAAAGPPDHETIRELILGLSGLGIVLAVGFSLLADNPATAHCPPPPTADCFC